MIASVIGEELGLIGILVTVLAFAAFAVLGFRIAMRCKDPFGKYLVAGATCLVAGQAFVNLGAVLGVLPLTGVPLPLISSGGSSLVVMLALVGVMLNVADSEMAAPSARTPAARQPPMPNRKASSKRARPRVLIAAGGTAGHVVPALAVAAELSASGAEVEFAGGDRIEARLVPEAGYPLHTFEVRGFERRLSPGAGHVGVEGGAPRPLPAGAIIRPGAARRRVRRGRLRVRPDAAGGAGIARARRAARGRRAHGPRQPAGGAAGRARLPVVPDRGPRRRQVPGHRPSDAAEPADRRGGVARRRARVRRQPGRDPPERRSRAAGRGATWAVLHVTGDREYEQYRELDGDRYRVRAFLPALHWALRGAKLVVARAGGSIFEIAAAGKPSILVPSPNVTADHQTANARHLERAGGAVVIPDAELTHERLDSEVRALLADPERMRRMGEAALAWARPDAAAVIADDLLRLHRR